MEEYALYKGEELLAIGTIRDIAKEMKVKESTIYYYKSKAYKDRLSKRKYGLNGNARMLVSLDY